MPALALSTIVVRSRAESVGRAVLDSDSQIIIVLGDFLPRSGRAVMSSSCGAVLPVAALVAA